MSQLTATEVMAATTRGALKVAVDPDVRFYSPDTIARVYQATVAGLSGAGSFENAAATLANDPTIADVPDEAVERIMVASFKAFALSLREGDRA